LVLAVLVRVALLAVAHKVLAVAIVLLVLLLLPLVVAVVEQLLPQMFLLMV
jgi:hypothetical protein